MSRRSGNTPPPAKPDALGFTPMTAILGAAALIVVGIGYFLLWKGDITAAPLLLVLGYLVLFPAALAK